MAPTNGEALSVSIVTRRDVLLRTARSVGVSVCATLALTYGASSLLFGADPDAFLRAGDATVSVIYFGAIACAIVGGVMSYRANLVLQQFSLARSELWRISRTDQLTGLLNRRGFDEAAIAALEKAHRENLPAVALMCDIDRFKTINDQFGHEFGDAVLVQIGEVLNSFAKGHDILVGRHGGEEFVALVIGVTSEQAMEKAEMLRLACAEKEVSQAGTLTPVTISIGVAASKGGDSLSKMLGSADHALYAAKRGGRNRIARADVPDNAIAA
jgi:diguanylate cyclase (GGDEF)-like protein